MPLLPGELLSFQTGRGSVLIGPSFLFEGGQHRVSDGARVRELLRLLTSQDVAGPALRSRLDRWGLDASLTTGASRHDLAEWLARRVEQGCLCLGLTPDLTTVHSRVSERQDEIITLLSTPDDTPPGAIPDEVERRLFAALERVAAEFDDDVGDPSAHLRKPHRVARLTASLLAWSEAGGGSSLHTAFLAHDLRSIPAGVTRALDDVAQAIRALADAQAPDDMAMPTGLLSRAVATLARAGILRLFLQPRNAARAQDRKAGTIAKPKAPSSAERDRRRRRSGAMAGGGGGASAGGGGGGSGSGGGEAERAYEGPQARKALDETGSRAMTRDQSVFAEDQGGSDDSLHAHERVHAASSQHKVTTDDEVPSDAQEHAARKVTEMVNHDHRRMRGGDVSEGSSGGAEGGEAGPMAGRGAQQGNDGIDQRNIGLTERRMADGGSVHSGPMADRAMAQTGARAMTMDGSVMAGSPTAGSADGDNALHAHERVHQMQSGGSSGQAGASDDEEQAAESVGRMIRNARPRQ